MLLPSLTPLPSLAFPIHSPFTPPQHLAPLRPPCPPLLRAPGSVGLAGADFKALGAQAARESLVLLMLRLVFYVAILAATSISTDQPVFVS